MSCKIFKNQKFLEVSILVINILSLIIIIISSSQIPWNYIRKIKIIIFITNMFFVVSFIFLILFYLYVYYNKNNFKNISLKCYIIFPYISIIISFIFIILMIIDSILIIKDLKKAKREIYSYNKKKLLLYKETKNIITKEQWIKTILCLLLIVIFWIITFILWIFNSIIIKKDYYKFKNEKRKFNVQQKVVCDSTFNFDKNLSSASDYNQTNEIIKLEPSNISIKQIKKENKNSLNNINSRTKKLSKIFFQRNDSEKKDKKKMYNQSLKINLNTFRFKDEDSVINKSNNSK